MINIQVVTPQGKLFSEKAELITVRNQDGEQAIMKDHVPVVVAINPGYIRLNRDNEVFYVTIVGGFLEFSNNTVNVVAQEAEVGTDHLSALKHLEDYRKQRLEENRQRTIDFTKAERELREHISKINSNNYR